MHPRPHPTPQNSVSAGNLFDELAGIFQNPSVGMSAGVIDQVVSLQADLEDFVSIVLAREDLPDVIGSEFGVFPPQEYIDDFRRRIRLVTNSRNN